MAYIVGIGLKDDEKITESIVKQLQKISVIGEKINTENSYDLIICDNHISEDEFEYLENHMKNGKDVLFLGGTNEFIKKLKLPLYDEYELNQFRGAKSLKGMQNQILNGEFSAKSAVGFIYPNISWYYPLIKALDEYGNEIGYASGVLCNYEGTYKGSNWIIYSIEASSFYYSDFFIEDFADKIIRLKDKYFNTLSTNVQRKGNWRENFKITNRMNL